MIFFTHYPIKLSMEMDTCTNMATEFKEEITENYPYSMAIDIKCEEIDIDLKLDDTSTDGEQETDNTTVETDNSSNYTDKEFEAMIKADSADENAIEAMAKMESASEFEDQSEQQAFQMHTIRDILVSSTTECAEDSEKDIIKKIIDTVYPFVPTNWESWKVTNFSPNQLLGNPPDTKLLNKLRYAIPTSQIASAFGLKELSEKTYRRIKIKMLDCPILRTLIYAPYSIAVRVHGGNIYNFIKVVKAMKPQLRSRKFVDDILRQVNSVSNDDTLPTPGNQNRLGITEFNTDNDAIAAALERQTEMFQRMIDQMTESADNIVHRIVNELETIKNEPPTPGVRRPYLTAYPERVPDIVYNEESEPENESDEEGTANPFSTLYASTAEDIPIQSPEIFEQGSSDWNKISYKEIEKRWEASSVFTALKVNPELSHLTPQEDSVEFLQKFDNTLAVITNGLLQQAKALRNGIERIRGEFGKPKLAEELRRLFLSSTSKYQQSSRDLFLYVYGRRSYVISMRRAFYKSPVVHLNEILQSIPPSDTHLFDEKKLNEALQRYGGVNAFFPQTTTERPDKRITRVANGSKQRSQGVMKGGVRKPLKNLASNRVSYKNKINIQF